MFAGMFRLPEGTEIRTRFNEKLSSASAHEGDQFGITLDEPIQLPRGVVIPAGYRGVGEVTAAKKKGMMGKAGELNIRVNYLKLGDTRVHLRGNKGGEGEGKMGTTIVLTALFGPLGCLKHGNDIEIAAGQKLTA